eukprot:4627457-Pyramimonas_sp.AAC.1
MLCDLVWPGTHDACIDGQGTVDTLQGEELARENARWFGELQSVVVGSGASDYEAVLCPAEGGGPSVELRRRTRMHCQ